MSDPTIETLNATYLTAKAARLALEQEQGALPAALKAALLAGDVNSIQTLNQRKSDLPGLIQTAWAVERTACAALTVAQRAAIAAVLGTAEESVDAAEVALQSARQTWKSTEAGLVSTLNTAKTQRDAQQRALETVAKTYSDTDTAFRRVIAEQEAA